MASITLITLGVGDVGIATAFYEALGFVTSSASKPGEVSFLDAGGVVLSLFGRQALDDDSAAQAVWTGNGGIVLAHNLNSEAEVDAFVEKAKQAGAMLLKRPAATFWGGYSGHFADPDGHIWEIAHNPFLPLDAKGRMTLPD